MELYARERETERRKGGERRGEERMYVYVSVYVHFHLEIRSSILDPRLEVQSSPVQSRFRSRLMVR